MKSQYSSLDLKKALGNQRYLVVDDQYKKQLAAHPLVQNLWTIGRFFVIVANISTCETELASGECEQVSGYTREEVEKMNSEFLFNFALDEDNGFNMEVSKLGMNYFNSRPPAERATIFAVYFYRAKRKDGTLITIQHQAIPLYFDVHQTPFIFSNIITDISYLRISTLPHGLIINRATNDVFHIEPRMLKLVKARNVFSKREREIIGLLIKGHNSRLIAQQLYISHETVRTHRKNILKKTGLSSMIELLGYSITQGIL